MVLEAKHISFRYGKESRQILEDFHLKMTREERVGLIAPSGFGKTTFCKILAGYERPDEGEVLLDGRPLSSFGRYCPVQMIWQHPEQVVNPRLKMREVLAEGDGIEPRVIEGLGIEPDWLNRYPGEIGNPGCQLFPGEVRYHGFFGKQKAPYGNSKQQKYRSTEKQGCADSSVALFHMRPPLRILGSMIP